MDDKTRAIARFLIVNNAIQGIPGFRWSKFQIEGTRALLHDAAQAAADHVKDITPEEWTEISREVFNRPAKTT